MTLKRNVGIGLEERGLVCWYDGCMKVCKSKEEMNAHERLKQRVVEERARFECGNLRMGLKTARAKVYHERSCTGGSVREAEGLWWV